MGGRKRTKELLQEIITDNDELVEAMIQSDLARTSVLLIDAAFNRCGNCPWRMKCLADLSELLNMKYKIFDKSKGINSEKISACANIVLETMLTKLSKEDTQEMMDKILDVFGADVGEFFDLIDELFGDCHIYQIIEKHLEG